jgi:hypothetical protein
VALGGTPSPIGIIQTMSRDGFQRLCPLDSFERRDYLFFLTDGDYRLAVLLGILLENPHSVLLARPHCETA